MTLSFADRMEYYRAIPDGPDPDDVDVLNAVGFYRGYLWQAAERHEGEDIDHFPLLTEALTCAALFDRDPAEALDYVRQQGRDYDVDLVHELVRTTELLPFFVEIHPPAQAMSERVDSELIFSELIGPEGQGV